MIKENHAVAVGAVAVGHVVLHERSIGWQRRRIDGGKRCLVVGLIGRIGPLQILLGPDCAIGIDSEQGERRVDGIDSLELLDGDLCSRKYGLQKY